MLQCEPKMELCPHSQQAYGTCVPDHHLNQFLMALLPIRVERPPSLLLRSLLHPKSTECSHYQPADRCILQVHSKSRMRSTSQTGNQRPTLQRGSLLFVAKMQ